eukprot:373732_1
MASLVPMRFRDNTDTMTQQLILYHTHHSSCLPDATSSYKNITRKLKRLKDKDYPIDLFIGVHDLCVFQISTVWEEYKNSIKSVNDDSDVPPQEPVDPQQELALVVIDYEAEFQFETDHKQQDTTVVSDRVFSKQKQEIIDRYIASKIARINKNESLIDILSDYAFHTLNDPILNHFEQQIMAFFATK